MVVRSGHQAELHEDVLDVRLDRLRAQEQAPADPPVATGPRPSSRAPRVLAGSGSASGSSFRARPRSCAITSGSIAVPPRPTRPTASRKSSISRTRSLRRYPKPSGRSLKSAKACAASTTWDKQQNPDFRVLVSDLSRRTGALVGMRGRHPHVDHRDVRLAPPNRVAKLVGVARTGPTHRSRPRREILARPSRRSAESSAITTRTESPR